MAKENVPKTKVVQLPLPTNNSFLHIYDWQEGFYAELHADTDIEKLVDVPEIIPLQSKERSLQQLVQSVPFAIRQKLCRYTYRQFYMIHLTASYCYARQLCMINPNLFWLWVNNVNQHKTIASALEQLQRKAHHLLLDILGDSAATWVKKHPRIALKWLSNIVPTVGNAQEFQQLLQLLAEEGSDVLAQNRNIVPISQLIMQLKFLNLPHMLIEKVSESATNSVRTQHDRICAELKEGRIDRKSLESYQFALSEQKSLLRNTYQVYTDAARMAQLLRDNDSQKQLVKAEDLQHLEQLHDELAERFNQQRQELLDAEEFPEPPIPSTDTIIAITNSGDLMREGREMHHCVGSYREKVMFRRCYIYKVLAPERATLELGLTKQYPSIVQFRKKYNQSVSEEAIKLVEEWIFSHCNLQ